jgi:uncharacterized protein (TIGR00290 family)
MEGALYHRTASGRARAGSVRRNRSGHAILGRVAGRTRAIVSWSTGKDAAFALEQTRGRADVEVVGLLTTISSAFGRVSMHGVREELLRRQVAELGLPCVEVRIPSPCPNEVYEEKMGAALVEVQARGVTHVVFGDLFLQDVRAYREAKLATIGMHGLFPLWGRDTKSLADEMLGAGMKATITCVDPRVLPASFAGRAFDRALLRELPAGVDPCGENGEFHTFVHAGPMFRAPIEIEVGEVVERDGFVFADLLPRG